MDFAMKYRHGARSYACRAIRLRCTGLRHPTSFDAPRLEFRERYH